MQNEMVLERMTDHDTIMREKLISELAYLRRRQWELEDISHSKILMQSTANTHDAVFLRKILDCLPDAIYVKDLKARKMFSNKTDIRRCGFAREEEVLGKSDFDVYEKELADAYYADDVSVLKSGIPVVDREEILIDSRGRRHWTLTSKYPIWNSENKVVGLVGIGRDITKNKNGHDKLITACNELKQFTYVASHDLQEPLRVVNSYMELLLNRYRDQLDENGIKYIQRAMQATTRMKDLINDLLQLTRIESGGKIFKRTVVTDVVAQVVKNLKSEIKNENAKIIHGYFPAVNGDEEQLSQLFHNLISNALKFTKEGVQPEIVISGEQKGNMVNFEISDNGIGIENKYLERIFKIFQRLHSRKEYSGTGIGLALCKKIVERHEGTISVESVLHEGSKFHFTIPIYNL